MGPRSFRMEVVEIKKSEVLLKNEDQFGQMQYYFKSSFQNTEENH